MNVDVDEIEKFAINHFRESLPQNATWNGRQIRNAFQKAAALAEYDAWETNKKKIADGDPEEYPKLGKKHFKIVAKTSLDFDFYMKETVVGSEADRALWGSERADEFVPRKLHRNQRQFETSESGLLHHEQFQHHSGPRNVSYQQSWQPGPISGMHQPYQPQPQQPMQSVRLASNEEQYSQRQYIAPDGGYSLLPAPNPTLPVASQPRNESLFT